MNLSKEIIPNWLDKNNMVKPQGSWTDSGNGLLYTAVFLVLDKEIKGKLHVHAGEWYKRLVESCYLKPGCLKRSPSNTYQEQWDDYLGVVAACVASGNRKIPRQILWFGLTHFFFFNTDDKLEWKDWLGRYPHLWLVCWCAAFPFLKYPLAPILLLAGLFMKPNMNDTSGIQLEWLFRYCVKEFGFAKSSYKSVVAILPEAFAIYYDKTHPFQEAAKELNDV